MRVMTILGTRPEIIRLSLIMRKLDALASQHIVVHTGQNYDQLLSDVFFAEMNIRQPDFHIRMRAHSLGSQIGTMFAEIESLLLQAHPDALLVLGDTNSALCALLAARMQLPVYHMEAGNRCYDTSVPEEINRRAIDAVATFNLPYTKLGRDNLLREGNPANRIWISGNPIYEVLTHYDERIEASPVHSELGIEPGQYLLVTCHRQENVDNPVRLKAIVDALDAIAAEHQLPIICSVHPRTQEKLARFQIAVAHPLVRLERPFGFFAFACLQKYARCVLTDSGTVQEESCIYHVPAVTVRQSTERPETVLCGSNAVAGVNTTRIVAATRLAMAQNNQWELPEGYADKHVSQKVTNFLLGGLTHV